MRRTMWGAVLVACAGLVGTAAHAENHALILWIDQYTDPQANLPGIDTDARRARQMALAMGVSEDRVTELSNEQLRLQGLAQAMAGLTQRIGQDDKVFIYFSGHGAQRSNTSAGKKCSEGLVAQDVQLYFDRDLEADLQRLSAKASQVVMMNDSCFSGGASTKSLRRVPSSWVAKAFPAAGFEVAGATASVSGSACGDAVNKGLLTKNFEVVQRQGARLLYLAASRDNEVSYATPQGSLATQAWAACLSEPRTDTDRSGSVSGEELRVCSQARINANPEGVRQHITLTGTAALPLSFALPASAAVGMGTGASTAAAARVNPVNALRDLRSGADPAYAVKLTPAKTALRIGQDSLDFNVEVPREGYLYILQVGSDGQTFNLLFPNKVDSNNQVTAGLQRFPRPSWAMRSAGPAGTNHVMALLSATPKDFSAQMNSTGTFAALPATRNATKSLVVVATGAAPGGRGRYGTSEVVAVREVP